MSITLFYFAKAIESTAYHLGLGKFEGQPPSLSNKKIGYLTKHSPVSERWKCPECLHHDQELCTNCKESWLHEVSNTEYSDAFERRLNITAGSAGCVMGITGALANASMGFWEEGDVMEQVQLATCTST